MNYQKLTAELIETYKAQLPRLKRQRGAMLGAAIAFLILFVVCLLGGAACIVIAFLFPSDFSVLLFLIGYIASGVSGLFLFLMILFFVLRKTVVCRKIRNRREAIKAYGRIVKYMNEILENE